MIYTLNMERIQTFHVSNAFFCLIIGCFLGIISSFLEIGGGILGRYINKNLTVKVVDKLFKGLMVVIICINIYNIYQFM